MTAPYIDLFNLAYSTNMSESVKEEIINCVELPIHESVIEIPENIYESLYILDELAYSNMSEGLINSIIDRVFEGCSEEYLEEVYEAYVRAKALTYISEGSAPIGLRGLEKEVAKRNEPSAMNTLKNVAGYTAHNAKEGIKSAVGKVKNWWSNYKQKANDWASKKNASQNAPKVEPSKPEATKNTNAASKPEGRVKDQLHDLYKGGLNHDEVKELQKVNKLPSKQEVKGNAEQLKLFEVPKNDNNNQEVEDKNGSPAEDNSSSNNNEKSKQLSFLTPKGNISKRHLPKNDSNKQAENTNTSADKLNSDVEGSKNNDGNKSKETPAKEEAKKEEPKVEAKAETKKEEDKNKQGDNISANKLTSDVEEKKNTKSTGRINLAQRIQQSKANKQVKNDGNDKPQEPSAEEGSKEANQEGAKTATATLEKPKREFTGKGMAKLGEKSYENMLKKRIEDGEKEIAAAKGKPAYEARIPEMQAKLNKDKEELRKLQGAK